MDVEDVGGVPGSEWETRDKWVEYGRRFSESGSLFWVLLVRHRPRVSKGRRRKSENKVDRACKNRKQTS